MKILMLTPYLPYPLFSGGQVRSYNIIKELSKRHEITLFAVIRNKKENEHIGQLAKFCKKVVTFERGKAFSLSHILMSGFTLLPFILAVYKLPKLAKAIEQEARRGEYDVVHVETFYLMHNIPTTNMPIVLFEQNIEYDVYSRIAQYFDPPFLRPLLLFDVFKMKKWEEYFWKKAKALVVMSEADKKFLNRDAFVCGNGVDIEKFKVQGSRFKVARKKKQILFIGNFKWMENRDAVQWILTDIWPKIKQEVKLKLWIVGRQIPDSIKRLTNDENVIFDEDAPENTEEIFGRADVLLAPIRVGGGTSFKILEAMASGVPVVTTTLGAQSLRIWDREEVLISDTAEELAADVVEVLEDKKLCETLSQNARKLVEKKYDWKILVAQIEEIYKTVVVRKNLHHSNDLNH